MVDAWVRCQGQCCFQPSFGASSTLLHRELNPPIIVAPHSFHKEGIANGGNRYATVLTYLADTEEGGETVFPNIPAPGGDNGPTFSECARYHLAAKPKKGTAVLFHSIKASGEVGGNQNAVQA